MGIVSIIAFIITFRHTYVLREIRINP